MIIGEVKRPAAMQLSSTGLIDNEYTIRCNLTPKESQYLMDWFEGRCQLFIGAIDTTCEASG